MMANKGAGTGCFGEIVLVENGAPFARGSLNQQRLACNV
jgi:hypothetical protein